MVISSEDVCRLKSPESNFASSIPAENLSSLLTFYTNFHHCRSMFREYSSLLSDNVYVVFLLQACMHAFQLSAMILGLHVTNFNTTMSNIPMISYEMQAEQFK
jgi:hypothetical protein